MHDIHIDSSLHLAPFEQVRRRVIELVRSGELPAGTRLPTVRGLAEDLGLAANTVARAYRELELDDVIETRGRNGSFVKATGDALHRQAQEAARTYAERVRQLGMQGDEALLLVSNALAT